MWCCRCRSAGSLIGSVSKVLNGSKGSLSIFLFFEGVVKRLACMLFAMHSLRLLVFVRPHFIRVGLLSTCILDAELCMMYSSRFLPFVHFGD